MWQQVGNKCAVGFLGLKFLKNWGNWSHFVFSKKLESNKTTKQFFRVWKNSQPESCPRDWWLILGGEELLCKAVLVTLLGLKVIRRPPLVAAL